MDDGARPSAQLPLRGGRVVTACGLGLLCGLLWVMLCLPPHNSALLHARPTLAPTAAAFAETGPPTPPPLPTAAQTVLSSTGRGDLVTDPFALPSSSRPWSLTSAAGCPVQLSVYAVPHTLVSTTALAASSPSTQTFAAVPSALYLTIATTPECSWSVRIAQERS